MTSNPAADSVRHPELKPCPFCGGPARVFQKWRDPKPLNWRVCCDNEDGMGAHCLMDVMSDFDSEAEAVAAWNRRAADAEVERLREALKRLADPHALAPFQSADDEVFARMRFALRALGTDKAGE